MRSISMLGLLLIVACGGSAADVGITNPPPNKKKALDPFLTVRIRDLMDYSTASGKAQFHIYYEIRDSVNPQGFVSGLGVLNADPRFPDEICFGAGADSVGQRLMSLLAIADTVSLVTPLLDTQMLAVARAWFAGDRVLPDGWVTMTFPPTDVWNSQQFKDGHGLSDVDPIRWGWDWTGRSTATLYERAASDVAGCNAF